MNNKVYKYILFTILAVLLLPATMYANSNCYDISPYNKVFWENVELKSGQIGRVTINSKTQLYKLDNTTFIYSRSLNKGERYRVYSYKLGYYGVGGGLYIKKDSKSFYQTPSKTKLSIKKCSEPPSNRITLFVEKSLITKTIGQPKKYVLNEYKLNTEIFHNNYKNLNMISFIDNYAHLIYSKDLNFKYRDLKIGDSVSKVITRLGANYTTLGNTNSEEVYIYKFKDHEINIFIDIHNDNRISAFYLISKKMSNHPVYQLTSKSLDLHKSYESQIFFLTNADRIVNNLNPLAYSNQISYVARKHSEDMAKNHYFNHTNIVGLTPFDRLANGNVNYQTAGENIAMGYTNPFYAHEALMNSLGHRKNKLNANYTKMGIGISFQINNKNIIPYYTENYINP